MVEIEVKEIRLTEENVDDFILRFRAFIQDAFRDTFKPGPNGRAESVLIDYTIKS